MHQSFGTQPREDEGASLEAPPGGADDATLERILEVFNRLSPKKDRREEMQRVTMPSGYDAKAERERKHPGR